MKLHIYQSDHGDCTMLESNDGARILVDGGLKGSFKEHVLPDLVKLDGPIDLMCVSHVDQDHINGLLAYMDNLVNWKVFRHKKNKGRRAREPREAELPHVGEIWHNAFGDTLGKNRGKIERFLALGGRALSAHTDRAISNLGQYYSMLATSVGDGIEMSRRINPKQLGIPHNVLFGGKFVTRASGPDPIFLGSLRLDVLAPSKQDVKNLRKFWNDWITDPKKEKTLQRVKRDMKKDEEDLASGSVFEVTSAFAEEIAQRVLGDRNEVSPPNLASIMFLATDNNGRTCLMTGDGHMDDVETGLENAKILKPGKGLHVNCLKIAHHGSEHNSKLDNYKRITSDHYVFCGNGHSDNPDPHIVEAIIDSRIGQPNQRSNNPETNKKFKLCFNSDPDDVRSHDASHMRKLRNLVSGRAKNSNSLEFAFQKKSKRTLTL